MLYLLSIGLHDEKDMSMRAIVTSSVCSKLYCEFYTDNMATSAHKLSQFLGRPVHELPRKLMEDGAAIIIEEARHSDVGVLIGGDALSATTHITLLSEARKAKVPVKVIHGSSIMTAVAETGLSLYKFGRTVTLTKSFEKSILDAIKANMKAGLHTLVLLDIGMTAREAVRILSRKLPGKTGAVAACRLGGDKESVMVYDELKKLALNSHLNITPAVICIPGKLHFMEEEWLQQLLR